MMRFALVLASALCCLLALASAKNPQGQYFYRGGVELYAETTGDMTAGPVMIFIGGSAATTEIWSGAVRHFKRKFSTVAFDLRGHGRSNNTATGFAYTSDFNFVEWSDDVHFVLKQLGVNQVICVGGNFGTNVCLQLEHDHHDDIAFAGRVTSGGNMLTVGEPEQWAYTELTPFIFNNFICPAINASIANPDAPAYQGFLSSTAEAVFSDQCNNMDELRQRIVIEQSSGEDKLLQLRKLGCFGQNPKAWTFVDQRSIMPALAARQTPCLVLVGGNNLAFSRSYNLELAQLLVPPTGRVRPEGRSTPIVVTLPRHSIYVYATDVDTFTGEIDKWWDYVQTGTQLAKCDTIKL
jgi:pimeloyl-ACP methyl ester carboxylesterase